MAYVHVDEEEVLEDCSLEQLQAEIDRRTAPPVPGSKPTSANARLEQVYEEFRRRGDAPQCLRDYIYDSLGKIL